MLSNELTNEISMVVSAMISRSGLDKCNCLLDSSSNSLWVELDDVLLFNVAIHHPIEQDIAFKYINILYGNSINNNISIYEKLRTYTVQYHIHNNDLLASLNNINELDMFNEYSIMKSIDGCKFFKLFNNENNYLVPIFSSFPNLNKGDLLSIYVYRYMDTSYIIARYCVYKNKIKREFNVYFRTLNLCQR